MSLEPLPDDIARLTLAYRRALGAFATGVCVVTADSADGPLGITVNSFASVSLEPRLVLWCLDERSERWPAFAAAERFAIHMLAEPDEALARRFARGPCQLEPHEYARDGEGPPRLDGVLARLECRAHQRIQMGDHMIIVGEVDQFHVAEAGAPLTFFRGRYGRIEDMPS